MTQLDRDRTELRTFTASVREDAARNLDLLRAIESTINNLDRLTARTRADLQFADRVFAWLEHSNEVVDPDEKIQAELEAAQSAVADLYGALIDRRTHARLDPMLNEEDGVEDAYTRTIAAVADLHNAINSIRWNIGEHDIDAQPKCLSKQYSADDIDKLFDDLAA